MKRTLYLALIGVLLLGMFPAFAIAADPTYAVIYNTAFDQSLPAQPIDGVVGSTVTANAPATYRVADEGMIVDPMLWRDEDHPDSGATISPAAASLRAPISRQLYELKTFYGYDLSKDTSENQRFEKLFTLAYSSGVANIWVEVETDTNGDAVVDPSNAARYKLADLTYKVGATTKSIAGGFTYEMAERVGDEFNEKIYPTMTETYGDFYDLDVDGKVSFLMYNVPGAGTIGGVGSYAITYGFFYNVDMDSFYDGKGTRNETDCVHMNTLTLAPELQDAGGLTALESTMAHEYQHLLEFSSRRNRQDQTQTKPGPMPAFVNEGMSVSAEHLVYADDAEHNKVLLTRRDSFNSTNIGNGNKTLYLFGDDNSDYALAFVYHQYLVKLAQNAGVSAGELNRRIYSDIRRGASFTLNSGTDRQLCADSVANIIADYYPGTTAASLLRDFHIATTLNLDNGPLGFGGDPFFSTLKRPLFSGTVSTKTLTSGAAVVVQTTAHTVNPSGSIQAVLFGRSDTGGVGYIDVSDGAIIAADGFTLGGQVVPTPYIGSYTLYSSTSATETVAFEGMVDAALDRLNVLTDGREALTFGRVSFGDTLTLTLLGRNSLSAVGAAAITASGNLRIGGRGALEVDGDLVGSSLEIAGGSVKTDKVKLGGALTVHGGTLTVGEVTADSVTVDGRTAVFLPDAVTANNVSYRNGLHPHSNYSEAEPLYTISGNVTLPTSLVLRSGVIEPKLYLPTGTMLTIPDGMTLNMSGGYIYGPGQVLGTIVNTQPPTVSGDKITGIDLDITPPATLDYGDTLTEPTVTTLDLSVDMDKVTANSEWMLSYEGDAAAFGDIAIPGRYVYTLTITAADGFYFDETLSSHGTLSYDQSALLVTYERDVARATITVDGLAAVNREYDKTEDVEIDVAQAIITGLHSGDEGMVTVESAAGKIASSAAGNVYAVTVDRVLLAGEYTARYTVDSTQITGLTVDIARRPLTLTTTIKPSSVVEGTGINSIAMSLVADNLLSGDSGYTGTPSFTIYDKNGQAVTALNTVGSYTVRLDADTVTVDTNYTPTLEAATLTVTAKPGNPNPGDGFGPTPKDDESEDEPDDDEKDENPDTATVVVKEDGATVAAQPDQNGGVTAVLGGDALQELDADVTETLTVESPLASIRMSTDALQKAVGEQQLTVTVHPADLRDGALRLSVAVDGEELTSLDGGLFVTLPLDGLDQGAVVKIVSDDGTETVLRKSVMSDGFISFYLPGSATVVVTREDRSFSDTNGLWALDDIAFVTSRGLFNGTSQHLFSPNIPMSRAMLVTVLHRLEDMPEGTTGSFADVSEGSYYADAVGWATQKGIVLGTGKGFEPDKNITREQLAVMLYRYAQLVGTDVSVASGLDRFADGDTVSEFAHEAMEWAVAAGIIGGKTNGLVDPQSGATRAEVAAMLHRLVKWMVR